MSNERKLVNEGEIVGRDAFISHASEDKESIARPLAMSLSTAGLRIWLDEFELLLGDSLREKVDHGLRISRFGIVILSKAFFAKSWTKRELNALIEKEAKDKKVVLPIWHGVERDDVARFSPMLVDKMAIQTSEGLDNVTKAIQRAVTAANSLGMFRVFSYSNFENSTDTPSCHSLQYVTIDVSGNSSGIDVHLDTMSNFELSTHTGTLLGLASNLWEPCLELACLLGGWNRQEIAVGRVGVSAHGSWLRRSLDAPYITFNEWKGYNLLIHFRGWQLDRTIDNDYIDVYFIPIKNPYSEKYEKMTIRKPVLRRLIGHKAPISEILSRLAAVALGENASCPLALRDPVFEKDCTPVWGGDAYWFRGLIL